MKWAKYVHISEKCPSFNQLTPVSLLVERIWAILSVVQRWEPSRVQVISTYPSDSSAHGILEAREPVWIGVKVRGGSVAESYSKGRNYLSTET